MAIPTLSTHVKGQAAEDVAAAYLTVNGYRILRRNIFTPFGEIDILAKQQTEYVCVEVRSRSHHSPTPPELSLNRRKYQHLVRSLLSLHQLYNQPTRIDLVTVEAGRVRRHFRNIGPP
jgi:putative endonuclease